MADEVIRLPELDYTKMCYFCGRPAKYECDMPVSYSRWVGHPPHGETEMEHLAICRTLMCEDCAIYLGEKTDVHICPSCADKVIEARLYKQIGK